MEEAGLKPRTSQSWVSLAIHRTTSTTQALEAKIEQQFTRSQAFLVLWLVWDRLSGHANNSNDDRTSFILGRRWRDSRSKSFFDSSWNRFGSAETVLTFSGSEKRNVCDEEAVPPVSDLFLKKNLHGESGWVDFLENLWLFEPPR